MSVILYRRESNARPLDVAVGSDFQSLCSHILIAALDTVAACILIYVRRFVTSIFPVGRKNGHWLTSEMKKFNFSNFRYRGNKTRVSGEN